MTSSNNFGKQRIKWMKKTIKLNSLVPKDQIKYDFVRHYANSLWSTFVYNCMIILLNRVNKCEMREKLSICDVGRAFSELCELK